MPLTSQAKLQQRKAVEDPHATASVLLVVFLDLFGQEPDEDGKPLACIKWAPETIRHEMADEIDARLPDDNLSKLMAACQLLQSDEFYKNPRTFNEFCVILSEGHLPGVFVPADAAACAWGITEAYLLSPPDPHDEDPFDDEIRAYIGKVIQEEGIIRPPDVLRLAVHDPHLADRIRSDFDDDPELMSAITKAEDEKTQEIDRFLRERLSHTMNVLESLTLQHGDTREMIQKIHNALG